MAKKKKKKTKKNKAPKGEARSTALTPSTPEFGPPSAPPRKVKFPCRLCKGDHLLRDFPGIPRVLEVWSRDLACPSSSTKAHVDVPLSTHKGKEKGKIRIPCRLCEGNHPLHLCPLMDKASAILESLTASSPQLPVGYQRLSSDPLLVDKEIDLDSSLVHPPPFEPGCPKAAPDQPLVGKSIDLGSQPVDYFVSEEHDDSTTHVLLISSDSHELNSGPPISVV